MYQRTWQRSAELLEGKALKDEAMAQSGVYFESGTDYLKRVVQVVDLEFKIRPDAKGSASYVYMYTTGMARDAKETGPVEKSDLELQQTD